MLLFLPATVGLYFLRPSVRWKNGVLLAASLFFYAWGEPVWVFALVALTLAVWLCSLGAARLPGRTARRLCALAGVALPLGTLLTVKYAGFLLSPLLAPLGLRVPEIRMPLGISFFTFQIITYVIDAWRNPALFQPSPLRLLLYVSCFPQLVAGPIVRYGDVAREIAGRRTDLADFACGMQRFSCGLGKKVLLANLAGRMVEDLAAAQASGMSVLGGWAMAVLYTLQVYFDFSGYSDMAIGMGRIFGFHYLENFRYPLASASVSEFWRRWHISLGSFFREYVYIPLGGNRCGLPRQAFNLLVVWSLTGLWHGASLNFVLWGLYFFLLLLIERLIGRQRLARVPVWLRIPVTCALVCAGFVIFYHTDIGALRAALRALAGLGDGARLPLATPELAAALRRWSCFPALALFAALPLWRRLAPRQPGLPSALWAALLFALSLLFIVGQSYNPFIYFRF